MKNPIEEFLEEKKANFGGLLRQEAKNIPSMAARGIVHGGVAAGLAAGASLVAGAASKMLDAATKARDFKAMLEHNPDLADYHAENPRMFNQMFSSLRTMNPTFSKDPLVAGTYMRNMWMSPQSAGGTLTNAYSMRNGESSGGHPVYRGMLEGAKAGLKEQKEQKQNPLEPLEQDVKRMKLENEWNSLQAAREPRVPEPVAPEESVDRIDAAFGLKRNSDPTHMPVHLRRRSPSGASVNGTLKF